MAEAVCADRKSGLRARVADAREVEDEERYDERAEAIDERAAEENPGCRRQSSYVIAERLHRDDVSRGDVGTRRKALGEFEADAFPEMAEDRADQRAGGVPDDVVDVGDSVGEEVLPPLDRAGEGEAEQDGQNVRLQRRPIDRVERDEEQESPRHE